MSINIFNLSFGPHYTFFVDFCTWDKHISIWQQICGYYQYDFIYDVYLHVSKISPSNMTVPHTRKNEKMCIQLIDLSRQCRYYKYWFNNDTIYSLSMSINIFNFSFGPHYTFFVDFCTWDKHISIRKQIIIISSYMVPL